MLIGTDERKNLIQNLLRNFAKSVRDNGSQLNIGDRETVLETILLTGHKAGQFETIAHQITQPGRIKIIIAIHIAVKIYFEY